MIVHNLDYLSIPKEFSKVEIREFQEILNGDAITQEEPDEVNDIYISS